MSPLARRLPPRPCPGPQGAACDPRPLPGPAHPWPPGSPSAPRKGSEVVAGRRGGGSPDHVTVPIWRRRGGGGVAAAEGGASLPDGGVAARPQALSAGPGDPLSLPRGGAAPPCSPRPASRTPAPRACLCRGPWRRSWRRRKRSGPRTDSCGEPVRWRWVSPPGPARPGPRDSSAGPGAATPPRPGRCVWGGMTEGPAGGRGEGRKESPLARCGGGGRRCYPSPLQLVSSATSDPRRGASESRAPSWEVAGRGPG